MKKLSNSPRIVLAALALSATVFVSQSHAFSLKQNNVVPTNNFVSSQQIIKVLSRNVNGRNVNTVFHSQGRFVEGAGGNWSEIGNNGGKFNFREQNRDDWSVYLFDASRNVNIQLDLHTRTIYYSDSNSGRRPLYQITDASMTGNTAGSGSGGGINGRNVKNVKYSGGRFKLKGGGRWEEKNSDGKHNFVETGRDDWSVYLTDSSRGVNIQLDLHTKNIYYSDQNTARRVQYKITSVK